MLSKPFEKTEFYWREGRATLQNSGWANLDSRMYVIFWLESGENGEGQIPGINDWQ